MARVFASLKSFYVMLPKSKECRGLLCIEYSTVLRLLRF